MSQTPRAIGLYAALIQARRDKAIETRAEAKATGRNRLVPCIRCGNRTRRAIDHPVCEYCKG